MRISDWSSDVCSSDLRFAPHIFSVALVGRGKPAPDLFLHAARALNAAPGACLVIEDSVAGVTAACRAGMTAFGFTGGGHCDPELAARLLEAGAALVFDRMARLPETGRRSCRERRCP